MVTGHSLTEPDEATRAIVKSLPWSNRRNYRQIEKIIALYICLSMDQNNMLRPMR
jgi:hypothetical protein